MKLDSKKIRATIKERGMTMGKAAEEMGFTRQRLYMILRNESTLLGRVDDIARVLHLDPKDLLI